MPELCDDEYNFTAAVSLSPPLVFLSENHTQGLFVQLLKDIIQTCCHKNASLDVTRIASNPQELHKGLSDDEQVVFPYTETTGFSYQIRNASFLPIVSSPGAVLLVDIGYDVYNILSIITVTWQLLVVIAVSCAIAGVTIWILETFKNEQELPRSFHEGFWEGLWWAFVSMTTVGYGDVTPKSIAGRLFAMLWIIVGICIFAVFTATLTAALTKETQSKNTIHGRKIAVLNGTEEQHLAALLGAKTVAFENVDTMIKMVPVALNNRDIEGILIDYVYLAQFSKLNNRTSLRTFLHIPSPKTHGILLQAIENKISQCFQKEGLKKKYDPAFGIIFSYQDIAITKLGGADAIDQWLKIKNIDLIIYVSCVAGAIILLALWELVYWRPRHKAAMAEAEKARKADNLQTHRTVLCTKCNTAINTVYS